MVVAVVETLSKTADSLCLFRQALPRQSIGMRPLGREEGGYGRLPCRKASVCQKARVFDSWWPLEVLRNFANAGKEGGEGGRCTA